MNTLKAAVCFVEKFAGIRNQFVEVTNKYGEVLFRVPVTKENMSHAHLLAEAINRGGKNL